VNVFAIVIVVEIVFATVAFRLHEIVVAALLVVARISLLTASGLETNLDFLLPSPCHIQT